MDSETFYGVTLTREEPVTKFEINETDNLDRKLIIKQAVLGEEAKDGEFNVVQAEVRVNAKETMKIPIAVLKSGETRTLRPNIEFPSTITFELIHGVGPVHLYGQQIVRELEPYGDEEYDDDDDDEDDVDDDDGHDDEGLRPGLNGLRRH